MKNLIEVPTALVWLVLCIAVALFLLTVALIYNGYLVFVRFTGIKKIELPKIQIAR